MLVTVKQVKKCIVYALSTTFEPFDLAELKNTDVKNSNQEMTKQSEQRLITEEKARRGVYHPNYLKCIH